MHHDLPLSGRGDGYLIGPRQAWFAFAMTIGLMVFDYVDRQVIVSLFPHLKAEWGVSDTQLGALVSAVSVTVAIAGIPVALFADRVSRLGSIVAMGGLWSLATIACMFTGTYGQLLAARTVVGLGEAGYGSVGAGLIASHFPARMRGALMAGFFASASVGSVLGVMLGGIIASHWGWKAAFGVVGFPGLVLALLYVFVRDYRTVQLTPKLDAATRSARSAAAHIGRVLARSRTMLWMCVGAPAQVIVISAVWSWLPSYLNRVHGLNPRDAGVKAALVVLCGALGSVVWGSLVDRAGRSRPGGKLRMLALLCLGTMLVLGFAFGAPALGLGLSAQAQFALIACGGFLMTCTAGPAAAIVIDVTHPGVRSTGASVLSLFQNLFGLALGPVITGALSDRLGLATALSIMPAFSLVAVGAMLMASRTYAADIEGAGSAPAMPDAPISTKPAVA
ncbi:MAG TPA: MFS transporter [Caldimonas sp.]|nr:MFS transporter [Caldimonas sp.]